MQTTKRTIITLDIDDSIEVRILGGPSMLIQAVHPDGHDLSIPAMHEPDSEIGGRPELNITTSDYVGIAGVQSGHDGFGGADYDNGATIHII